MDKCEEALKLLLELVKSKEIALDNEYIIPVGISNRHVHLSQKDLDNLFGEGYTLTKMKYLSQPGQYACKETITICGPKGAIEKVRILGPTRSASQIEVMTGDCIKLGVTPEIKSSGDLKHTPGITLIGPKGSIQLNEGLIVAQRHIHMSENDAVKLHVRDGQTVSIEVQGLRGGIYNNVIIRANSSSVLECHLDIEEANAMNISQNTKIKILN